MSTIEPVTPAELMHILDPELADPETYVAERWGLALAREIATLAAAFDAVRNTAGSPPLLVTGNEQEWQTPTLTRAVINGWRELGYQVELLTGSASHDRELMQLPEDRREAAWAAERDERLAIYTRAGGLMSISTPSSMDRPTSTIDPKTVAAFSEQVMRPLRNVPLRKQNRYTIMPALSRHASDALDLPWNVYIFPIVLSLLMVDWEQVAANMSYLSQILQNALEVQISGPNYQLTFSLDGFRLFPSTTRNNLIGAELFTAPVIDSVEGEFLLRGTRFVGPGGLRVRDLHVRLERGVITTVSAEEGAEAFKELFAEAFEHPCIGEIGLGGFFNPALWPYSLLENKAYDNFMRYVLLSEKIGDHIAFGDAYKDRQIGDTYYRMDNGATFSAPGGIRGHFDFVMGRRKMMRAITSYGEQITLMHNGDWVPALDALDDNYLWAQFNPLERAAIAKAFRWADRR